MGFNYRGAATQAGIAVLKASPVGQAYSAAKGIISAPAKLLGSIFGGGPPAWKRSQTFKNYESARDLARGGDREALEYLAQMAGLRPGFPATKYSVLRDRARAAYYNFGGNGTWEDTGGSARTVGLLNRPVIRSTAATRAPHVCKYGPRDEQGRCPKKPPLGRQSRRASAGGATSRPCKYGERDADGRCPPRSSRYGSAAARRAQSRAERAVTSAITRGARRLATPANSAALASAGGAALRFAAKASLVGAAGFAAYWLTTQAMKLRYRTYQDLRNETADLYRLARRETAQREGRGLTPAESASLSQWFKSKTAEINANERAGRPITSKIFTFKE